MSVVVVGLSHRTVPLDLLERMAIPRHRLPKALGDLAARPFVSEVALLSTCHRIEAYVVAERFHGAVQDVRHFLSERAFVPPEEFSDHLYTYYDEAAANHLFSVTAGLDSLVLGESQILGQVPECWDVARQEGTAGAQLSTLVPHALGPRGGHRPRPIGARRRVPGGPAAAHRRPGHAPQRRPGRADPSRCDRPRPGRPARLREGRPRPAPQRGRAGPGHRGRGGG